MLHHQVKKQLEQYFGSSTSDGQFQPSSFLKNKIQAAFFDKRNKMHDYVGEIICLEALYSEQGQPGLMRQLHVLNQRCNINHSTEPFNALLMLQAIIINLTVQPQSVSLRQVILNRQAYLMTHSLDITNFCRQNLYAFIQQRKQQACNQTGLTSKELNDQLAYKKQQISNDWHKIMNDSSPDEPLSQPRWLKNISSSGVPEYCKALISPLNEFTYALSQKPYLEPFIAKRACRDGITKDNIAVHIQFFKKAIQKDNVTALLSNRFICDHINQNSDYLFYLLAYAIINNAQSSFKQLTHHVNSDTLKAALDKRIDLETQHVEPSDSLRSFAVLNEACLKEFLDKLTIAHSDVSSLYTSNSNDIEFQCNLDINLLDLAIALGDHSTTSLLIDKGANPTLKNQYNVSPLHLVMCIPDEKMFRILFESKHVKIDPKRGVCFDEHQSQDSSLLHLAATAYLNNSGQLENYVDALKPFVNLVDEPCPAYMHMIDKLTHPDTSYEARIPSLEQRKTSGYNICLYLLEKGAPVHIEASRVQGVDIDEPIDVCSFYGKERGLHTVARLNDQLMMHLALNNLSKHCNHEEVIETVNALNYEGEEMPDSNTDLLERTPLDIAAQSQDTLPSRLIIEDLFQHGAQLSDVVGEAQPWARELVDDLNQKKQIKLDDMHHKLNQLDCTGGQLTACKDQYDQMPKEVNACEFYKQLSEALQAQLRPQASSTQSNNTFFSPQADKEESPRPGQKRERDKECHQDSKKHSKN